MEMDQGQLSAAGSSGSEFLPAPPSDRCLGKHTQLQIWIPLRQRGWAPRHQEDIDWKGPFSVIRYYQQNKVGFFSLLYSPLGTQQLLILAHGRRGGG